MYVIVVLIKFVRTRHAEKDETANNKLFIIVPTLSADFIDWILMIIFFLLPKIPNAFDINIDTLRNYSRSIVRLMCMRCETRLIEAFSWNSIVITCAIVYAKLCAISNSCASLISTIVTINQGRLHHTPRLCLCLCVYGHKQQAYKQSYSKQCDIISTDNISNSRFNRQKAQK